MSGFGRSKNETTSAWLERLIAEGAPADVRANVQAILEDEARRQLSVQQAGKFDYFILYINFSFSLMLLFLVLFDVVFLIVCVTSR
jgi:hypothetical protein